MDTYGNTDEPDDDVQYAEATASPEDKVFVCKNPVCGKAFLQRKAEMNHTCSVRQKKQSSKDFAREYYISKNGISKQYQNMSFKDTRGMVFHKGALPAIDPLFLRLMRSGPEYRESLAEGHALVKKKERKMKSQHLITYLDSIFEAGEKDPSKRKKAPEVAKELRRRPDMTEADWLTESQVQSYFSQKSAKKRYSNVKEPSRAMVDDTNNLLIARSHAELTETIQQRLSEGVPRVDQCPITSEGVQLCYLAASIKESKKLSHSQIETVDQKMLKKSLKSLGIDDYGGGRATKPKMAKIIIKYVEDHCDCLTIE